MDSDDIADFSEKSTDLEKCQMIQNAFSPNQIYKFPKDPTTGRSFQFQWLSKYPWLRYSKRKNGGYCLPCVLFSRNRSFRSDPGVLVTSPLIKFKNALEILRKHTEKDYHKEAVASMDTFIKVTSGQQQCVSLLLSNAAQNLVANNRKKL